MLIQWIELNDLGLPIVKEHPKLNVRNVGEYAKSSCRLCNGNGIRNIDSGSIKGVRKNDKTNQVELYNIRKQERIYTCDCVDRILCKLKGE